MGEWRLILFLPILWAHLGNALILRFSFNDTYLYSQEELDRITRMLTDSATNLFSLELLLLQGETGLHQAWWEACGTFSSAFLASLEDYASEDALRQVMMMSRECLWNLQQVRPERDYSLWMAAVTGSSVVKEMELLDSMDPSGTWFLNFPMDILGWTRLPKELLNNCITLKYGLLHMVSSLDNHSYILNVLEKLINKVNVSKDDLGLSLYSLLLLSGVEGVTQVTLDKIHTLLTMLSRIRYSFACVIAEAVVLQKRNPTHWSLKRHNYMQVESMWTALSGLLLLNRMAKDQTESVYVAETLQDFVAKIKDTLFPDLSDFKVSLFAEHVIALDYGLFLNHFMDATSVSRLMRTMPRNFSGRAPLLYTPFALSYYQRWMTLVCPQGSTMWKLRTRKSLANNIGLLRLDIIPPVFLAGNVHWIRMAENLLIEWLGSSEYFGFYQTRLGSFSHVERTIELRKQHPHDSTRNLPDFEHNILFMALWLRIHCAASWYLTEQVVQLAENLNSFTIEGAQYNLALLGLKDGPSSYLLKTAH